MKKAIVISPKWQIIGKDLQSLGIGLGVTLAGAGITYLTEYFAKADYGEYTPIIVAVWALIANVLRKLLTEKQYIK